MRKVFLQLKKDHKGVTLIEILVAMAILGIVALVFARGFILTAQVNQKARKQHSATTLAQNVMEQVKAYNYSQLVDQKGGSFCGGILTMDSSDNYKFKLENVDSQGHTYDVVIELKPDAYEREMIQMANIDPAKDIAISNIKSYDEFFSYMVMNKVNEVIANIVDKEGFTLPAEFSDKEAYKTKKSEELYKEVLKASTRSIVYTVYEDGIVDKVQGTYVYKYPAINEDGIVDPSTMSDFPSTNKDAFDPENLYPDLKQDVTYPLGELRNLYIFFTPAYGLKSDDIKVSYKLDRPMDLYVVKQNIYPNAADMGALQTSESSYKIRFTLDNGTDCKPEQLYIYTNMNKNLSTGNDDSGRFEYNNIADLNKVKDLYHTTMKELMMDATVKVYDNATAAEVAQMKGSIRN